MLAFSQEPQSIVMKYYPLGSLQAYIYSTKLRYTKGSVVHLLTGAASALCAMHENGLAHCDIKVTNIYTYLKIQY